MAPHRPPSRRVDLSALLRRAQTPGWKIQVLDRGTVLVRHPECGEVEVSALFVRPESRRRLEDILKRREEAREATREPGLSISINPDLMRL
jgi:hypothetical protein